MAIKLEALTNAVTNVASLAKSTVEANAKALAAKVEAEAAHAARVVAETARDEAHKARALAEAVVVDAQTDIDRLVAELEAAIGHTVATLVPGSQPAPVVASAPLVAPVVAPAPTAPQRAPLAPVAPVSVAPATLSVAPQEAPEAPLDPPVPVVPPVAPDAPVATAVDPVAPAELHGLAAVSAALGNLIHPSPKAPVIYPPFDPRSKMLPQTPNAPKA